MQIRDVLTDDGRYESASYSGLNTKANRSMSQRGQCSMKDREIFRIDNYTFDGMLNMWLACKRKDDFYYHRARYFAARNVIFGVDKRRYDRAASFPAILAAASNS